MWIKFEIYVHLLYIYIQYQFCESMDKDLLL